MHVINVIKEGIAKGGKHMSSYVLGFQDIDNTKLMVVGGKGSNLGELSKIEGIRVPDGFCISTEAFQSIIGETSSIHALLDQLSLLKVEDRDTIGELSAEIRSVIDQVAIVEQEGAIHRCQLRTWRGPGLRPGEC
jgi:rifampicin phosphotransferase